MFLRVLATEFQKLKRSAIPPGLAVVYCIAPLMLGLMMLVMLKPELGQRLGLFTAKAEMTIGAADWKTYLQLTSFLFAGGMIVLGIVHAFIFGREYLEGTAKNLLALPVSRTMIVGAKLVVSAVWFLAVAIVVYGEALLVGLAIGLPGFDPSMLRANIGVSATLVLEAFLAGVTAAFIAVATRGYIAPVGFAVLFLLLGDFFSHTGWGPWIPWSIVLMTAGAAGADASVPGVGSYVVLAAYFVVLSGLTVYWTDRMDLAS